MHSYDIPNSFIREKKIYERKGYIRLQSNDNNTDIYIYIHVRVNLIEKTCKKEIIFFIPATSNIDVKD